MFNSLHSHHVLMQVGYCTRYLLRGGCELKPSQRLQPGTGLALPEGIDSFEKKSQRYYGGLLIRWPCSCKGYKKWYVEILKKSLVLTKCFAIFQSLFCLSPNTVSFSTSDILLQARSKVVCCSWVLVLSAPSPGKSSPSSISM